MLWIWRYIMGYLLIKIHRENGEQLLNRAVASRINIWNLRYKDGYIYGNISAQNFLKLRKVHRGTKCKISIIKKCGLIFYIKKHKNRIGFVIGIITFFSIIIYLTNFIWIINVEGNNVLPTSQIIASCKKIGIYEGIAKNKINNKYAAQRFQLIQDGIAWCSFNTEGCILTVNLSETMDSVKEERKSPSNLKSAIEGKIKRIDVSSGNVLVKVGDTVSKGVLLVSGIIVNNESTLFVHSSGEIIADTTRTFSSQGDFVQSKIKETGEVINRYTIEIFKHKIPLYLGKIKQPYNYKCEIRYLKVFGKKIPIKIACEQYKITQKIKSTYDEDELVENLDEEIKKQLDQFKFLSAVETERETICTDKGVLLKITYNCEENIALQDEILLSEEN